MGNESELWNKILSRAIALPFVIVVRESFFRNEFALYFNHDMLDIGIKESPLKVLH